MAQLDMGFRHNLIVATQRLSKHAGLYPACYSLKDVEVVGDHPIAAGSFADIYKGNFQGRFVCMKVIRVYQATQVEYFLTVTLVPRSLCARLFNINTSLALFKRGYPMGTTISPKCSSNIWPLSLSVSNLFCLSLDGKWRYQQISKSKFNCEPHPFGKHL